MIKINKYCLYSMFLIIITCIFIISIQAATPIKLTVDGVDIACNPAPTMIGNKVFVPIRCVAEALDKPVDWNQNTKTVIIGVPQDGLDMTSQIAPFKMNYIEAVSSISIAGVKYNKGYKINGCEKEGLAWKLGSNYSKISFYNGCPDNKNNVEGIVIKGDGKQIGLTDQVTTSEGLQGYTIDVDGVNILEITRKYCGYEPAYLISPRAYK